MQDVLWGAGGRGFPGGRVTSPTPGKPGEQLSIAEVAARIGVTVGTAQTYRAQKRLPDPDGLIGRTPWWWATTIDVWQANRPGRGRAGIPRKK